MTSLMFRRLPEGYIAKSTVYVTVSGTLLYGITELFLGSEGFYKNQLMPLVHKLVDGETAHRVAIKMAKYGLMPRWGYNHREYPELECKVLDRHFKNPVGLAAGFDKDGEAIDALRKSGLGFVEVGSVTPLPQYGNKKPRVFRLVEDEGVVNSYGFNNAGVGTVFARVKKAFEDNSSVPLGVNLGKNKTTADASVDYEIGVNYFGTCSDYLVVNVSSPNTPGLRKLQQDGNLKEIMTRIVKAKNRLGETKPKVLLKISPDLGEDEKKNIAKIALNKQYGIDGLIVSNTTLSRPTSLRSKFKDEPGGLSGKPLKTLSTECVRDMYRLTAGKIPIVGCGGISSGEDAYEKIRAGASLVQLYSALVFQGYPVIGRVKRELAELLRRDGYSSVSEAVGVDHKK